MKAIVNTTFSDLEFVYHLFESAIDYQKRKGFPVWNGFDKAVLKNDVKNSLQFKIVDGDSILCVFSICFNDKIIWREKEKGDAIYLHRIVVNPIYKGQKQFETILNWAKDFAKENNRNYIRMDTWGDNQNIIAYYQSFGFKFIENFTTPSTEDLPIQHRNLFLTLLEYDI
ncbi:GNAT family N-acetyltransferase [Flavobacterium branchiophilum]|uniref:GNAT family N-acetyltransferase n=1 Tax=Flavobacterium branchiophilum TaxID=55197 RepID=UPI001CC119FD|nr:GNAT family N-acetyltransferase [Flavobacterium branchiophilum]